MLLHLILLFGGAVQSALCMPAQNPSDNVEASPTSPWGPSGTPHYPHRKPLTIEELQARQPLDGLPSNSNVTLVYAALGIGHQNYTCNGTAYVQSKTGDGASALLYDVTRFLEYNPREIKRLAQDCNYAACKYPQILDNLLGDHYFSALVEPTFNLTRAQPPRVLSAVKTDAVTPNPKNVAWLFLTANPANDITNGLKEAYRFDTYRGVAPASCDEVGETVSVAYTAQYWFYD